MSQPVCPKCDASLDEDLIASTGSTDCPFCGAALDTSQFITPATNEMDSFGDGTATLHATDSEVPTGSKIQVIESSDERMVIFIPPGGKNSRGIGCFALMWNGFMAVFTPPWFLAGGGADGPEMFFLIPFLGLFWAIGLGMFYWWIRMRFMRTYILLEKERLTIQRILFNRKSLKETFLGHEAEADLVESYSQNDVPVYAIAVNGTNRTAKFGTALSREEKDWFVEKINLFLGVIEKVPEAKSIENDDLDGFESSSKEPAVPDINPATVPFDGPVTIQDASDERLQMSYRAIPQGGIRTVVGGIAILFSFIWFGVGISMAAVPLLQKNAGAFEMAFAGIAGLVSLTGFAPLMFGFFMLKGKMTVNITREWLRCRWHIGPFGYSKKMPTASITQVTVATGIEGNYKRSRRHRRATNASGDVKLCMVHGAGKYIPLTFFHEVGIANTVAGLARHQLHTMGFQLQDD